MPKIADVIQYEGGAGALVRKYPRENLCTLSQLVVEDSDRPIIVVNHNGMYDAQAQQFRATAQSQFARAAGIDRSIMVGNSQELINKLNEINNEI